MLCNYLLIINITIVFFITIVFQKAKIQIFSDIAEPVLGQSNFI